MSIPDIIHQRKQFVSNTYQFYTQHAALLDEIKESIVEQMYFDLEEESKVWNKWQKKMVTLKQFNLEIQEWMKSQKNQNISQKRIIEISYLKSSFESQAETAKKHYLIYLKSLEAKRKSWGEDMALYLVRTINQNSQHKIIRKEIDAHVQELLEHSKNWNNHIISQIDGIMRDTKEIINFCENLIDDIESAKSPESTHKNNRSSHEHVAMVNSAIKSFHHASDNTSNNTSDNISDNAGVNTQSHLSENTYGNTSIGNACALLSDKIFVFQKNYDFQDISSKLNLNYATMRENFIDVFSDSSMSGIRASIKIIIKLNLTKAKLEDIITKMYEINELFKPYQLSFNDKKKKMIQLCVNAQKLEENTALKWIEANVGDIFAPLDKKIQEFKQASCS